MTGRQRLAAFLAGDPAGRAPVVPLCAGLAARVGGVSQREMTSSPSEWVNALSSSADLLDADAIVVGFDHTLVAEAMGAEIAWEGDVPAVVSPPARLPEKMLAGTRLDVALETANRLFPVLGERRGAIAAMTGPVTLATQLLGAGSLDRLGELRAHLVHVVEAYCKTRPQMLLLIERGLGAESVGKAHQRAYNTLRNIASHFSVPLGLYLEGWSPAMIESLPLLGLEAYLLGPGAGVPVPDPVTIAALGANNEKFKALGVPGMTPGFDPRPWIEMRKPRVMFLSSGALGADTDIETIRRQVVTLKA